MRTTVEARRTDLSDIRRHATPLPPLPPGAVRLKVDSFAVTANTVTYAVTGERLGYWKFFSTEPDWGVLPAWGQASVAETDHPDIALGELLYGYLPMSTHLDVYPDQVSRGGFVDKAAHRQPLSVFYNQYRRLAADSERGEEGGALRMILQPLFTSGFVLEAMFRFNDWFGAKRLIITSASSKTALAVASVAQATSPNIVRVGVTSPSNAAFVRASGLYDRIVTYDDVAAVAGPPAVVVDIAGSADVRRNLHAALGDGLRYVSAVGGTHVLGGSGDGTPVQGPSPVPFFAPDYLQEVIGRTGAAAFAATHEVGWRSFVETVGAMVTIERRHGLTAAVDAFVTTFRGEIAPNTGVVVAVD